MSCGNAFIFFQSKPILALLEEKEHWVHPDCPFVP